MTFFEAHGSGTPPGDAIEVAGLNRVYGGLPAGSRALGSVKTNIGHLAAAAGSDERPGTRAEWSRRAVPSIRRD